MCCPFRFERARRVGKGAAGIGEIRCQGSQWEANDGTGKRWHPAGVYARRGKYGQLRWWKGHRDSGCSWRGSALTILDLVFQQQSWKYRWPANTHWYVLLTIFNYGFNWFIDSSSCWMGQSQSSGRSVGGAGSSPQWDVSHPWVLQLKSCLVGESDHPAGTSPTIWWATCGWFASICLQTGCPWTQDLGQVGS